MGETGVDRRWERLCVFMGSSMGGDPVFQQAAREMGRAMCQRGLGLVYGGGSVGLMGVLARTVLDAGYPVEGVIPRALAPRELSGPCVGTVTFVETMHERKARMASRADAFVVLPGGLGTMDEFFEVMTWLQLGVHQKPIGLLNTNGFFDSLLDFLRNTMARNGFLRNQVDALIVVANEPTDLLDRLATHVPPASAINWEMDKT